MRGAGDGKLTPAGHQGLNCGMPFGGWLIKKTRYYEDGGILRGARVSSSPYTDSRRLPGKYAQTRKAELLLVQVLMKKLWCDGVES